MSLAWQTQSLYKSSLSGYWDKYPGQNIQPTCYKSGPMDPVRKINIPNTLVSNYIILGWALNHTKAQFSWATSRRPCQDSLVIKKKKTQNHYPVLVFCNEVDALQSRIRILTLDNPGLCHFPNQWPTCVSTRPRRIPFAKYIYRHTHTHTPTNTLWAEICVMLGWPFNRAFAMSPFSVWKLDLDPKKKPRSNSLVSPWAPQYECQYHSSVEPKWQETSGSAASWSLEILSTY